MLAPATAFYAIALVALKLLLVGRIIALRQRLGVGIGDGGYRELQTAIRVHGNYLEYLPLVLVLMFIAEMNGVNYAMLHVAGLVFVVSRFGHAYGLSEGQGSLALGAGGRRGGHLAVIAVPVWAAGPQRARRQLLTATRLCIGNAFVRAPTDFPSFPVQFPPDPGRPELANLVQSPHRITLHGEDAMSPVDSFNTAQTLESDGQKYRYYSLEEAAKSLGDLQQLPVSLKVLLENLLRHEDNSTVTKDDIQAIADWLKTRSSDREIEYRPARVLMQDFTGVPGVVDLAAMRDAVKKAGGDPEKINPLSPVDLVIDHSVMVDKYATSDAFRANVDIEMTRNRERYEFLRWGQEAFDNFRVVPPGTGICHQVNLEYLGQVAWTKEQDGETQVYPDTLVGTDSPRP